MATFVQLQDRVKRRIIDLPADTVLEIPGLINEAIRAAERRHNFRAMKADQEFVTANLNHILGTLTSFKEVREKPWVRYNDGGQRNIDFAVSEEDLNKIFSRNSTLDKGRPQFVFQASVDQNNTATFEVYPYPDQTSDWAGGNWRVNIPYWKFLPDLSLSSDTNWFTNNAVEFVTDFATGLAFEFNEDEGRADRYFARAGADLKLLMRVDKNSYLPRVNTLVPRADVYGSARGRRL